MHNGPTSLRFSHVVAILLSLGLSLATTREIFAFTYTMAFWAPQTSGLVCSGLAGGSWIAVPGNTIYGTSDFCVQKYIPSNNGNNIATAQAGTDPWVSISQSDAQTRCSALGAGYHLITNPEWMTVAADIANLGSNWSGGSVGNGELTRGHSDNSPASACAANADDSKGWVETDCTAQTQGSLQFRQRRTQYLTNGSVIWDIGGNTFQWIDYNNASDKPTPATAAWYEFTAITGSTTTPKSHLVPLNSAQSWWTDSWNSTQGIGQIYPGINASGGALRRGANWNEGVDSGLFAAAMDLAGTSANTTTGFRCAYTATTTTLTYVDNGASSGSAPTDPTAYSPTRPVTIASSGTLARTGFTFAGWNTAANGSGTTYTAGSTLIMGTSNVTLYALWAASSCGGVGDNCYNDTTAITAATAITPSGKNVSYTNGVWVEAGSGTRVLAADGSDNWAYQLSADGRSYSSTLLDKANVAGRVCPTNVFVPGNLVATGKCLYYDAGNAGQMLHSAGSSQTIFGQFGLQNWTSADTGNSTGTSWYEGNIQTCAAKGMRLPTLYETTASEPSGSKPTDASPTFSTSLTGVPSVPSSWNWTASGATNNTITYWVWSGTSTWNPDYNTGNYAVRCVTPGEGAVYTISYDTNGATSGTAPSGQGTVAGTSVSIASNSSGLIKNTLGFVGWNTAANGSGISYMPGSITMPAANLTLYAQYSADWTRQMGVAGKQTFGRGVASDAAGNIYITGESNGGLDGNALAGTYDAFVSKYNSSGSKLWTTQVGAAGNTGTYSQGIISDVSGNTYVTGYTTGGFDGNMRIGSTYDAFIVKFDSAGSRLWSRQLGVASKDTYSYAITSDASGSIYFTGATTGGLDGNTLTGTQDMFVTKYNSDGTRLWTRQLGVSTKNTLSAGISTDTSGSIYVTGRTFGGLAGNTLTGTQDMFVTKYDNAGTQLWTRQLGGAALTTSGNGLSTDASGSIYVTGNTNGNLDGNTLTGTQDMFVTKYNSAGTKLWTRQLGASTKATLGMRLTADAIGRVYIAGYTPGGLDGYANIGAQDFFVTSYDSSGNRLWSKQWGISSRNTVGTDITDDPAGNLLITGYTNGGLNGNTHNAGSSLYDAFVHKLVPITYTVSYNANGATSGTAPTSQTILSGGGAPTASNTGTLVKTGNTFAGWSTTADGTGSSYLAGTDSVPVANANLILYAKWFDGVCGASGDSCYNFANIPATTIATTPGGKSLTFSSGVWVESGAGTRVLAADGSDNWAYQLSLDGRSYSASLLNKANVAGRVCPINVFVPGNLVATDRCLYHDSGNTAQRLDATANDSVTNQTTAGSIRLGAWNTSAGGNSLLASWYEGNIQTCAAKGMRLPTVYESTTSSATGPTDANPVFSSTRGLSSSTNTWSASAQPVITNTISYYLLGGSSTSSSVAYAIRCVNPGEAAYTVTYDTNGATSGTAPTDSTPYAGGATVTTKSNSGTLARTGYVFNGWNTAADGSGTNYTAGSGTFTMGSANVTLFAKWTMNSQTFAHTGATQTFTVPAGVTSITIKAWGGGGGAGNTSYAYSGRGGGAGYATGTLSVTPGESLTVIVGGGGTGATNGGASAAGGFGGGGIGYSGSWASGGGGGRSAIRRASTELLTAAGGGGGGGNNTGASNGDGGAGGGSTGLDGVGTTINASGGGGTQSAGGIARCALACGNAGSAFTGGNGHSNFGGGGGGGYYGGGGGAYNYNQVGGGGGGSSYVPAGGSTTSGSGTTPGNSADPQWSNYGRGGATPGTSGDHGYVIITGT